jgi:hypothetical protein
MEGVSRLLTPFFMAATHAPTSEGYGAGTIGVCR